jgi:hypothetical protein
MNFYRANGMGIGGFLSRPTNVILEAQASCSLPIVGGHAKSRVDNFRFEPILSFHTAYTATSGSFDEMHKTHLCYASSIVEGLNIADIVTADRVVSRMTCSSPANDDDAEFSFGIIGSHIENLRIAGFPVEVKLAHELLLKYASYSLLEMAIKRDNPAHWLPSSVLKINDGYWCSAIGHLSFLEGAKPEGLKVLGTVIVIPDFGILRLAEMLIERSSRQLTMLQVELGSPIKGRFVVCSVDAGGKRDPFKRPDLRQETAQKARPTDAVLWQPQHVDAVLGGQDELGEIRKGEVMPSSDPRASAAAAERYANVCFTSGQNHVPVPRSHNLEKGARYDLRFDIGTLSPDSAVENAKEYPFPANLLPETQTGHWLEVVVASNDFAFYRNRYNLFLPEVGPSWVCSCQPHSKHVCEKSERAPYLFIRLIAPRKLYVQAGAGQKRKQAEVSRKAQSPLATLRLAVYYRKNLVQSQFLNAGVTQLSREGYGYRSKIDYTLAPGFRDVGSLPAHTLNILTNRNSDGSHRLVVNGKHDQAMTFNLSEGQMRTAVNSVRDALRTMHVKGNPPKLKNRYDNNNAKSRDDFVEDLRQLARTGWLLFSTLLQDKPKQRRKLRDELRENRATIQISRVGGSNFLYPWASVYDIGLESSNAHVPCRLLKEWSSSAKLLEDSTSRCPFEKEHATNTLCPFGFWGFRHSIELPPSMTDRALPQDIQVANTAPQIVIGLSLDLNKDLTEAHLKAIKEQLAGNLIVQKDSRATIHEALNNPQLEVVYFYCHGSRTVLPNNQGDVPYLKVGKNESISPSDITAWDDGWSKIPNHWEKTSPLVFINGCHTAELKPELLVNFVDTFAGVYAAGVIGTEVLVHQQLANEVALDFLKRFVEHKTVGRSISEMRLHFLRKGNLFGLAYTPYCSAELALAPRKS